MACRIIISPITKQEVQSETWNNIRALTKTDEEADSLYNKLASEEFQEFFGPWIENPGREDVSTSVNDIGEPLLTDSVKEFLGIPTSMDELFLQADEAPKPSKASPETIGKVKEFLYRIGVEIKGLDTSRYQGINGVADILNNVIEIANGKESAALIEEAMHFAVEIIKQTNPELYSKMLNKIGNYKVYKDLSIDPTYVKQFTKQGKLDVIGLKKEAIGKVLAEVYIQKEDNTQESPELLKQSQTWWDQIVSWFKSLIGKAGYNPFEEAVEGLGAIGTVKSLEKRKELISLGERLDKIVSTETGLFQDQINKFLDQKDYRAAISLISQQLTPETSEKVIRENLGGDEKLAQDIEAFSRVYLQATPVENPTAEEIFSKFDKQITDYNLVKHEDKTDPDDESNNSYYTAVIDGKEVRTDRTTSYANRENIRKNGGKDYFKTGTSEQKSDWAKKAMSGTNGHLDIEHIVNQSIKDDGTLKDEDDISITSTPLTNTAIFNKLQNYLLGDPAKGIEGFLFQFPSGTKFRTEQRIYNPSAKNEKGEKVGRAGTMDLVVVLPDGKVKIYDWKFMGFSENKQDQAPQKKTQHALQLADYRKTLKEAYGLKDVELFTVPIGAIYRNETVDGKIIPILKSVVVGNTNIREEKNTFLLPVVPSDQSSGNSKVDALVKSLLAHYKKVWKRPVSPEVKGQKIEGLNQLSIAIRNVQVALNFEPLSIEALNFKNNITSTIEKYKDLDISQLSKEDLNKHMEDLLDLLTSAKTYANLDEVFISEYGDQDLSPEKAKVLQSLRVSSSTAKESEDKIVEILQKYVVDVAIKKGFSPSEILSPTKEVKGITNSFLERTALPNATMNLAGKIVMEARSKDRQIVAHTIEHFGHLYTNLQKVSKGNPFDEIGDGNELKRKTKKEFWVALNEAYEKQNVKFILDNVDKEVLKTSIEDTINNRFDQIDKTIYTTDETENAKEQERQKELTKKSFNIFSPDFSGFDNNQFRALVKKAIIEEPHYTEEYKQLLKKPEALAMYNFITELNRIAFSLGYLSQGDSLRFFPFVLGTFLERMSNTSNKLSEAGSSLKDAFTVQDAEQAAYGKIDEETGQVLKSIPKFFTHTSKEDAQLSKDLLKVIPLYIRALQEFETSKELEMTLLTIHTVEKAKGHFEVENGKVIFEGDKPKVFNTNEVNAKVLENITDDAIYGIKHEGDTLVDNAVGKLSKGTEEEKNQKKLSVKKTIYQTNQWTQGLAVGLKVLVALPNYVGAHLQSGANSGLYYTYPEFVKNHAIVIGSVFTGKKGNVMKGLMDLIVPLNEDIVKEEQRKIARRQSPSKWLSTWSFQDVLMSTNQIPDKAHQLTNAYTWVENSMVVDGKIVNIRQYLQQQPDYQQRYNNPTTLKQVEKDLQKRVEELKNTKSLPLISKFNEHGILEIPGVSQEELATYRDKVVEYGRYITGQMSLDNKAEYRRNIIAQSFMMFKNWIPKQVHLRAKDIKKNPILNQWEYGRTRLFFKTWNHLGLTKILKIRHLVSASPEGIQIMRNMLEQKKEEYYQKTGQELEITEPEFFDMIRKELKSEFKELGVLFSVIAMVIAAKLAAPGDDEDALHRNRYKFWAKAVNKISDEMWFYYSPTSAESITRGSVLPSLGLLTKADKFMTSFSKESYGYFTHDKDLQDKQHPLKYFFNMFPVASQMQELLPVVFPEAAKSMGIVMTTQSRQGQ